MRAVLGQAFAVGKLTGFVESLSSGGAVIEFARVSSSGFARTGVGELAVLSPCAGSRGVRLLLAIDAQYHRHEFLEELRAAVFLALGIETERGWQITVAPRTKIEWRSDPPEGTVEIRSSG